jgi:hypothetical protein
MSLDLMAVISQVKKLKGGGTLGVMLGNHAIYNGFDVTIYTYNLHVFDPSWFSDESIDIHEKLEKQAFYKSSKKLRTATKAYQLFLKNGGKLRHVELNRNLLVGYLQEGTPIIAGCSATYLYNSQREIPDYNVYDDIKGEPAGHFVVLSYYDEQEDVIGIADPLNPNPIQDSNQHYEVPVDRVINAILLGILTYDANILIIKPR